MPQNFADSFPDQPGTMSKLADSFPDQPTAPVGTSHSAFIDSIWNYGKDVIAHPLDKLNEGLLPVAETDPMQSGRWIKGADGIARPNPNPPMLSGIMNDYVKPAYNETIQPLSSVTGILATAMGMRAGRTNVPQVEEPPAIKGKSFAVKPPMIDLPLNEEPIKAAEKPRLRVTPEGLKPVAPGESWADTFPDQPGESTTVAKKALVEPEKYQFTGKEADVAKQLSEPIVEKPKWQIVDGMWKNVAAEEPAPIVEQPKEEPSLGARLISEEEGSYKPGEITAKIRAALDAAEKGPSKYTPPNAEAQGAVGKLFAAIEDAKSLQGPQEELRSQERARRSAMFAQAGGEGQEWFKNASATLKGKYPSITTEPLKLTQGDVQKLFTTIKNSDLLPFEQKRTGDALNKLLTGAELPGPAEIQLLDSVYGKGFGQVIQELHGGIGGPIPISIVKEVIGLERALKTSVDMSWPLRQGINLADRPAYWKAFGNMLSGPFTGSGELIKKGEFGKAAKSILSGSGSRAYYNDIMDNIHSRPLFELNEKTGSSYADRVGLKLSSIEGGSAHNEENFMSRIAPHIPILNHSDYAYTGMANQVRADVFESMIKDLQNLGRDPLHNEVLGKQVAETVNDLSARSKLSNPITGKSWEKYATGANQLLFSPRLIASRLKLLNPNTYIRQQDPYIRKQYLRGLGSMMGIGLTSLAAAKIMGAQIDVKDMTNPDWMKARVGDLTRLDPWGGSQQYFVALSNTIAEIKRHIKGEKESPMYTHAIPKLAYYKLSPAAGTTLRAILGKDPITGQRFTLSDEVWRDFEPMFISDVREILQNDPKAIPIIPLDFLGEAMQTYQPKHGGSLRMLTPR